ncbi:unnamed protein product [Trypanosoma congolense IL3000]|uniref:WGS project CAEQ00000000 data, annotated contig 1174 n=1 Tax=Trypanosoma congolense (strain IL3000) TaxID=1068625 RepID=F9W4E4_TRYCI|nr:unnamed protein product [Trypanosoma congolense IL3000]
MLSDQMASQERYRKEVQKLQVELDQERSEHVRTRCELEATRDLSNLLKEQVERLRVSLAHSGVRQTSGSPCTEAHGYPPFCDAQSNFATTEPPPQQSNLSNLPQVLLDGESEAKDVDDVASKDSFQVGNPLLSNTYPLPTGDNITTQRNFENSFVELVSPSPECSSRLELGVFGDLLPSAEIKTRVTRAGGTARDDLGDCNKGDNCDVRGCFYFQQLAPGYSTRADKGLGTNSEFMQAIGKPLWSQRQEDIEELHHNAVNKDPPSIHPFDRLLGRDASLCKELLRALLDKEKELFELRSAFGLSGKGVK